VLAEELEQPDTSAPPFFGEAGQPNALERFLAQLVGCALVNLQQQAAPHVEVTFHGGHQAQHVAGTLIDPGPGRYMLEHFGLAGGGAIAGLGCQPIDRSRMAVHGLLALEGEGESLGHLGDNPVVALAAFIEAPHLLAPVLVALDRGPGIGFALAGGPAVDHQLLIERNAVVEADDLFALFPPLHAAVFVQLFIQHVLAEKVLFHPLHGRPLVLDQAFDQGRIGRA